MISTRFYAFLLVISSICLVIEAIDYKVPTDMATQAKLKKRGQGCMARLLPKTPAAKALQRELAGCFKVDCAQGLIRKVEAQFPREIPTLKKCMGY